MKYIVTGLLVAAGMVGCACWLYAQELPVPAGHWEGTVTTAVGELPIAIDLDKNGKGELVAAYSQPSQGIEGIPLSNVAFEDGRVYMELRGSGGGKLTATVTGTSMNGMFSVQQGTAPFVLVRTGDARFAAAPTSAAVTPALQGRWQGTLVVNGASLRLVLNVANHPDGTAVASIHSIDEGDVDIPVLIAEQGTRVNIDVKMTKGTFTGEISADGKAIAGDYKLQGLSLPLTFTRAE
jgi:hypothetical protein